MTMTRAARNLVHLALAAGLIGGGAGAAGAAPRQSPTFRPGASSANDPLTPGLGNGGYDVSHYDIHLSYVPDTGQLIGTTTITATATQNLSRFDFDFVLPARSVTVNGAAATFASKDGPDYSSNRDLVVTPAAGVRAGSAMTVVVRYSAKPGKILLDGYSDWTTTPTGVMAWDEPTAASQWWFPGNDYPSDKATYDVTVTAPKAYTAVSNGQLLARTVHGADATSHWQSTDPMASYVTTLEIGRYSVARGTGPNSVPAYYAYEASSGVLNERAERDVSRTPEVLSFLQSHWGKYPFASAGGIVVDYLFPSALETQTRPTYEVGLWQNVTDNVWAVVHENAHQWFGDSVTMRNWSNIWLAEGFATYSEWVWSQAHGQGSAEQLFLATYAARPKDDEFWTTPLNRPGYALDSPAYERGAMLLQALRNRVGAHDFYKIMRSWAAEHRHANAIGYQFVELAQRVSRQDLASFFNAWLYADHRPSPTVDNGFPAAARAAIARGHVMTPASASAITRSDRILAAAGPR